MFSYLRYFSTISFILLIIATITAGVYYRSMIINNIIKRVFEQNNIYFANNYIKQFAESGKIADETALQKQTYNYVQNYKLSSLTLYSTSGDIITSGVAKIPDTSDFTLQEDFLSAASGQVTTRITGAKTMETGIIKELIGGDSGLNKGVHKMITRSFIPIFYPGNNDEVQLIVEVSQDITHLWKQPLRLQIFAAIIIITIFTVFYAALLYTLSRAERIIAKQHESNLELIEAKGKAEIESEEKSKFLANVSHELRTPLNSIIGFSEILKDEVMGPINNSQYKDYINDIHASGVHLLSLINDILDFSKAEAGKLEVDMVETDITKVMQSCMRLVSPRAEAAGVALIDEIPSEHFVIKTDAKRLKQIILNLLSNSIKFTPSGGRVSLSGWNNVTEGDLHIEVKDTGIGIAPKDISKVMSTFGQVENEYSRKFEGTGLGLPLSKKLIEIMGGKFMIESQVGVGTKVSITLPKNPTVNHAKAKKEAENT